MHEQIKQVLPEWLKTRLREIETRQMVHDQPKNWRYTSIPPDRLAAFEADLRHVIGTIHRIGAIPVLVTHGRSDNIVLRSMAEHVASVCTTAQLSWYDDTGHMPFIESAERFNRELSEFVAGADEPGRPLSAASSSW